MNRSHYTGSSHELLRGDDCLSEYRPQIPSSQGLLREEAKGQCVPAREVRSGLLADASPECDRREPEVARTVAATLPTNGDAQANRMTARVFRAGMVSKGGPDDRGMSCIVPNKRVAKRRINKSEAMRCKNSDRPIVVMTLPERMAETRGMGSRRVGPGAKSEGLAKGSGIEWNPKQSAGNKGLIENTGRQDMGTRLPPSKIAEGSQGTGMTIRKPPERQMKMKSCEKGVAWRVGEGTTGAASRCRSE